MNIVSIDNYRASQRIHPLSLLAQMSSRRANGCLRVSDGSTSWWIYLNNGDLIHASHSVAPFKRLERHLRQMGHDVPGLSASVRSQVHQLFNTVPERDIEWLNPPDYQAIRWLVDKGHLTVPQAATLLEAMAQEVFETFLQVRVGVHELVACPEFMSSSLLCLLELRPLVEACQQRLREEVGPRSMVSSPYLPRSDYSALTDDTNNGVVRNEAAIDDESFVPTNPSGVGSVRNRSLEIETTAKADVPVEVEDFSSRSSADRILKTQSQRTGRSHGLDAADGLADDLFIPQADLSVSTEDDAPNSDDQFGASSSPLLDSPRSDSPIEKSGPVSMNHSSFPSTLRSAPASMPKPNSSNPPVPKPIGNSQFLRDPGTTSSPKPAFYRDQDRLDGTRPISKGTSSRSLSNYASPTNPSKLSGEKLYKVACIDDSPMILHMIEAFLEDKSFAVIKINDPVRALMELMRAKPDIILLDITMPNLDGYELCALLRSRPDFRDTPIIMVTGSKGLIDRAKARLVKASGYLTKPFNQTQLLKMIFKLLK